MSIAGKSKSLHHTLLLSIMFTNQLKMLGRASTLATSRLAFQARNYSTGAKKEVFRVRYIFYTAIFSTAALVLVATSMKKKQNKQSFTEKEFAEMEELQLLKRRQKIVGPELAAKVRFLAVPFVHLNSTIDQLAQHKKLDGYTVKVIDPEVLIKEAKADETNKFSFLLQDLEKSNAELPKGLVTGLIKEYLSRHVHEMSANSTKQPISVILKNYPQTTDDAMKFENDIGDILRCLVYHYDMVNELPKTDLDRNIKNVVGYFDTVGKNLVIQTKNDEMDRLLKEVMLEDI